MFSNLFFYNDKKVESELEEEKNELGFLSLLKNKIFKFKGNVIGRKKPKVRKNTILIKNVHKEANLAKKSENYNLYQDHIEYY